MFSIAEMVQFIKELYEPIDPLIPHIESCGVHNILENDKIFDSLRQDYPNFDA